MHFKWYILVFAVLIGKSYAVQANANGETKLESGITITNNSTMVNNQAESNTAYNPLLDPKVGCSSWGLWCDIKFGLIMAESSGVNGLMINGYAYHTSVNLHLPTGYNNEGGVNELALGAGYTRTFYNPQYNSEYSLYVMGFMDSFYKPELHIGYSYEKFFNLTDSGNLKWGIGYSPFIFVKPSLTNDAPIPLPGAGILTSLKYYNVDIMLTYANQLFLNARVDF